jgi:4-amino-4-deoxy-L-arabinose transferase-like glycosyltransferase
VFTVVDSGLTLIAVFLLRAIGLRTVSGMAANVAAGTYWFFPALWLFWSSREYVFWLPAIVFALATCLFVLRWFADRTSTVDLWLAGLCAGLAIWSYPLVACLIAPALVVLLWAIRRDIRSILGLAVAALVGVSPWLAYFAINGSAAFHLPPAGASKSANLVHSVSQVLPMALRGGQFRLGVIWGSSGTTPSSPSCPPSGGRSHSPPSAPPWSSGPRCSWPATSSWARPRSGMPSSSCRRSSSSPPICCRRSG